MAMGNTGTVNVTPEMINNAKDAIQEYKDTVKTLYSQLEDTMSALIPGNFSGSAADGFKYFYDNNIKSVANTDVNDSGVMQIITLMNNIVDGISEAIPAERGVDESLATEKRAKTSGKMPETVKTMPRKQVDKKA